MPRAFDVLAIGELNPDLILAGIDADGPELGTEQTFRDELLTLGSSTAIACVLMQRLGLRTAFGGLVGDDDHGRFCLAELDREGVDRTAVRIHPDQATGITISLTYAADRLLLTRPGTMRLFAAGDIDAGLVTRARHVHCGSYFLQDGLRPGLADLFARARRAGGTTSLDLGWDPSGRWDLSELAAVLPHTDIVLPNASELTRITAQPDVNDALDALHRAGAREIGLKQGADGGTVSLADGTRIALPGHRIVPVDTTGAGDAFNAGYLCAHLSGQTHRDKLALANACGAVTALSRGGTGGLNGLADATGMLERGTAAG